MKLEFKFLIVLTLVPFVTLSVFLLLAGSMFSQEREQSLAEFQLSTLDHISRKAGEKIKSDLPKKRTLFNYNRQTKSSDRSGFEAVEKKLKTAKEKKGLQSFIIDGQHIVTQAYRKVTRAYKGIVTDDVQWSELLGYTWLVTLDGDSLLLGKISDKNSDLVKTDVQSFLKKQIDQGKVASGVLFDNFLSKGRSLLTFIYVPSLNAYFFNVIPEALISRAQLKTYYRFGGIFAFLLGLSVLNSIVFSKSITRRIQLLQSSMQTVEEGNFSQPVEDLGHDEVGALGQSFENLRGRLKGLVEEQRVKAVMDEELKVAQTVQNLFFPEKMFKVNDLLLSGVTEPASVCGGDWWTYYQVENKFVVIQGDVTGHGVGSALITGVAQSASEVLKSMKVIDPVEILERLNVTIYNSAKQKMNMTMFAICMDLDTYEFEYANASHEAPLIFSKSGDGYSKRAVEALLGSKGPRLGEHVDAKFTKAKAQLSPGDLLLIYTDGIFEIELKGKPIRERQFLNEFAKFGNQFGSAGLRMDGFLRFFSHEINTKELPDDVSFLSVARKS